MHISDLCTTNHSNLLTEGWSAFSQHSQGLEDICRPCWQAFQHSTASFCDRNRGNASVLDIAIHSGFPLSQKTGFQVTMTNTSAALLQTFSEEAAWGAQTHVPIAEKNLKVRSQNLFSSNKHHLLSGHNSEKTRLLFKNPIKVRIYSHQVHTSYSDESAQFIPQSFQKIFPLQQKKKKKKSWQNKKPQTTHKLFIYPNFHTYPKINM